MGDDDDGFVAHQLRDARLYLCFVLGVETGCGFVEQDDGGVLQQGARDGDALSLAARERFAILADDRLVALGHAADKLVALRQLCHAAHFFVGGVALADADVIGNGGVEEQHVLEDDGVVAEQGFGVDVGDVVAAEQNLSAIDVPEACGQFGGGALASTRGAYEGGDRSLAGREGNVVQYPLPALVGEADVAEFDVVILHLCLPVSFLCRHSFDFFHAVDAHVEKSKQGQKGAGFFDRIVDHGRDYEKRHVDEY